MDEFNRSLPSFLILKSHYTQVFFFFLKRCCIWNASLKYLSALNQNPASCYLFWISGFTLDWDLLQVVPAFTSPSLSSFKVT